MEKRVKTKAEQASEIIRVDNPLGSIEVDRKEHDDLRVAQMSSLSYLPRNQNIESREAWKRAEELISNISARFIETGTKGLEDSIEDVLGEVGAFVVADNVHLYLFDGNLGSDRLFTWQAEIINQPSMVLPLIPSPWLKQQLSCSGMCHIAYPSSLPEEFSATKSAWESWGIRSLLAIPVVTNEALAGFIGLFSIRNDKAWAESDIITLRLVGEMLTNVFNQKRTEESLHLYEARMHGILNAIPHSLLWVGNDGVIKDYKQPCSQSFMTNWDIRTGMSISDLPFPLEALNNLSASIDSTIRTGDKGELQFPIHTNNGHTYYQATVSKSGDNEAACIIRPMADSLSPSGYTASFENLFHALANQSMVGIFLFQDDTFAYVNNHFASTLDYTENELIGKFGLLDLTHREDGPLVRGYLEKCLSGESHSTHQEFRALKKDGRPLDMEVCTIRTTYLGQPAVMAIVLDVSDRKRLETQLIQSERMKAIVPLAGGIAHDFNNILMAIQGYTSLMLHLIDPSHTHYSKLMGIEELISSGSDLTKQLLSFASGETYQVKPTDLNEIVRKTSTMFSRTKKEITIQTCYDSTSPVVDVDSGQIEQVLLNLYVNAWQAMPTGGSLTLSTKTIMLDKQIAHAHSLKVGKHALITVMDTGIGMDEKTRERVFEPFFTTKKRDRGTGLGLASVYNIIKGHGGAITVESEKGKGTTFQIYLPLSRKEANKTITVQQAIVKGKETILLVDDEETIITVNRDMLEALGYSVLIARSGKEAITIFEKEMDVIDLVILDVIMPDMGGEETFNCLIKLNPSVTVVLSSGYSLEDSTRNMLNRGCKAFIQKPFTIITLSQKLREVLGSDN